jgi:UDP-N-acetylenolpyruvoylglucosamine reductase
MEEKINIIASQLGEIRVKKEVDLNSYFQSGKGGISAAVYIATSAKELIKAVSLCRELKVKYLLIGSGSKMKVPVEKFDGLVIKNRSQNLKIFGFKGKVSRFGIGIEEAYIEADSGVTLSDLAIFSMNQGLRGFENLVNIRGTIGGSLLSNQILRDKVTKVKILDKFAEEDEKDIIGISGKDIIIKAIFLLKSKKV